MDRCNIWWQHNSMVVAVDTQDGGYGSSRYSVGCLPNVLLRSLFSFIGDVECLGEVLTQIVHSSDLKSLTVWTYHVERQRVNSTGKLVPVWSPRDAVRNTYLIKKSLVDFHRLLHLSLNIFQCGVGGVSFLEGSYLSCSYKRACRLCFVSKDAHNLIELYWEVYVRAYPKLQHGSYNGFACRSQGILYLERRQATLSDPETLFLKAFHVGGFLGQRCFWNHKGEQRFVVSGGVEQVAQNPKNSFSNLEPVGHPNSAALDWVSVVHYASVYQNAAKPVAVSSPPPLPLQS